MIKVSQEIAEKLRRLSKQHASNSILFGFQFRLHNIRCVYFGGPETLLISFADLNVAWQIEISNEISERIPNEVYKVVKNLLKGEQYSNRPLFLSLLDSLGRLESAQAPTNGGILELLKGTNTSDIKYDPDGDKPFFDHWRRVKPSSNSLLKIRRYFGQSIREECFKNKVTGVWSVSPTLASLDFMDPYIPSSKIKALRA